MKKKVLLSIVAIFVFVFVSVSVFAKESILNLSENTKAQAPSEIPSETDTLYAALTNSFNFSKVKFNTKNDPENGVMTGAENLRKIILSKTLNSSATDLTLSSLFGDSWFTAYCLDGELKYPEQGIYMNTAYLTQYEKYMNASSTQAEKAAALQSMLDHMVYSAVVNDETFESVFKQAGDYSHLEPKITYELNDEKQVSDVLPDGIKTTNFTVKIKEIRFNQVVSLDPAIYNNLVFVATATELEAAKTEAKGSWVDMGYALSETVDGGSTKIVLTKDGSKFTTIIKYIKPSDNTHYLEETLKLQNLLFNQYKTTNASNTKSYNQALWILEHSYPTLTIDETLELAGVKKADLIADLKAIDTRVNDTNVDDYLENYIYGTIQYAIWYVYGGKENLGDTIRNSTQLNKLYGFYIENRSEYEGYDVIDNIGKIKSTSPEEGKELYKTKDNSYLYGPYTVKFTGVMADDSRKEIKLSVNNSDKTGIKIVNEAGTEINSIAPDTKFYIEIDKKAQIGSVEIKTSVDAKTYWPLKNRAKVYYPKYSLAQNLMSGGKLATRTVEDKIKLTVNAKTGVENVAVLLMVTLVAFSLGYLVLSYKGRGSFLK